MNSIRLRLLASLLGVLALAALALGGWSYRSVLADTEELFDYQLRQMALSLRDQGAISPDQAAALNDEELDLVVQIWTVDGRTIYASKAHPELPERAVLGLADVRVGSKVWRTYGVLARDRVIQVAQPAAIRSGQAARAAGRAVLPLAWTALPLALLLWWLVSHWLAPLSRLAQDVQRRDAHSLQALPAQGLPDELAPLAGALNALLARLSESFDAQRAFVADAAHELRSPLTALKLQAEWLERAPDEADRREALAELRAGIGRAARLVEQLLALARSEPGAAQGQVETLDLRELVREAVASAVPLARSRQTELSLEAGEQPLVLKGERAALTALVRNLADNALRYSPEGAQVRLRLGTSAGPGSPSAGDAAADDQASTATSASGRAPLRPTLWVDDSGPGIPPAERERVFDRFYRRHADTGSTEGSGLGLAIVQSVARRHGARVSLGESPLGGLQVRVVFQAV